MATTTPTMNRPMNLGASAADHLDRVDALAKVTGAAKYGRDRYLPGSLFAALIRCPWGSAELLSENAAEVGKLAGVVEVKISRREATYHGRDVGYVLADSVVALKRAMNALKLEWKRREVKTRIEDTVKEAPAINEDAKKVLESAPKKLSAVYSTPVQTHSSLETHGCVVDHRGDSATVYASTQGTFSFRDGLDEALKLKGSDFEVICEYVGGGFGSKLGGPGKEGLNAARISAARGKPVYLFVNREEEHLDTGNRPSSMTFAELAFENDGTITGGQILTFGGVGVARGGGGCDVPSGRYTFGDIRRAHTDVSFNAGGPRAMRAPGKPQGAFAEELMLDEVALACNVDPLELRMKLARSGNHKEMMKAGAKLIGWANRIPTGTQTGTIRRGMGVGLCSWGLFPARAEGEVVIYRDGSVEARTGTQDIGTGQRTIMGVVAAEAVGINPDEVRCSIGSSKLPVGPGSGGSVTAPNTAPPMRAAALDAKNKLLTIIAKELNVEASALDIVKGEVLRGGQRVMSFKDACQRITGDSITGRSDAAKVDTSGKGHSDGVQFVDLSVDTETGVIHLNNVVALQSCGRVLARKTAESQIIGGVIQGLSYALFEQRVLDRVTGAMVNANLESYKILGPKDMPHITPVLWSKGQTKVCSLGEPPVIPTAGAVACAVLNAIGAPVRSLPITPAKVLAALANGGGVKKNADGGAR